jgi:uncharacterized protein (TIGR00369 family)
MSNNVIDDNYCFACGINNPSGLKLKFSYENEQVSCRFTPLKIHQGYKDIVHGGIISTLLDEVMAHLCLYKDFCGVTAKLEIKFKKPAYINQTLTVTGKIDELKGKLLIAQAVITNIENEVIAEGKSAFIKVPGVIDERRKSYINK